MAVTRLGLDYEGLSRLQLTGPKSVGLDNYMADLSTRATMLAWNWDGGAVEQVDLTAGQRVPPEVHEALLDPHVEKWAFNAQFEMQATRKLMGIPTPTAGWRCTMALAYMRSFTGGLGDVGRQLGLPADLKKDAEGKRLIKMFCQPQKVTRNQPHEWLDSVTNMDDWDTFLAYNRQDVTSETAIFDKLIGFGVLPDEWRLYEMDQDINEVGLPVDLEFVRNARMLAALRKAELTEAMSDITGLKNPNSTQQLLPWLQERGYPFHDLQKNTIKKAITENKDGDNPGFLDDTTLAVIRFRQQASRTSVKKYDAIERRISEDARLRFCFQFAGASRTNRWSGRGPQPQNLVRTPKALEDFAIQSSVVNVITGGDYSMLQLMVSEPMDALAGLVRASFQAPEGYEFVVCDYSAIESAMIGWLAKCKRLLHVFNNGLDPYKDFGTVLYHKPYSEITKEERSICKPPTLGCGFGLGGGQMRDGKRTGLWGYAEGMGVDITQAEAARQVKLFRDTYHEIPAFWKAIEAACRKACLGGTATVNGLLTFRKEGEYMTMELPSGRKVFYHKPKMIEREFPSKDGGTYKRLVFTCMGKSQVTGKWMRIASGGPKVCENAVQAAARDVLANGVITAVERSNWNIVGTVHDEIIGLRRKGDNFFTLDRLKDDMLTFKPWMNGLPLNAAGYVGEIYTKG